MRPIPKLMAIVGAAGLMAAAFSTAQAQTTPALAGPVTPGTIPSTISSLLTSTTTLTSVTTTVGPAGAVVPIGNAALAISPGAVPNNASFQIVANPASFVSTTNFGGPGQSAPGGTNFDIKTIGSDGNLITSFPQPITVAAHPNAADLSFANGNLNDLTFIYVVDSTTPPGANPNHFPVGTRVVVPNITRDPATGTIATNLNFIGSTIAVSTDPVGYVQTLNPNAGIYSSFDPATAQKFGTKPQFSFLQVVEPQIGNRLIVINPDTGNYGYVNATDVAPSGPPPAKTSVGAVRGLFRG
ncbi:MAG: hypothetical protein ACYDAG_03365 [Chloroflexota bacterium]